MAERTEQIVREAPEIEKIKLGLLESAKALPAPNLPAYQVAGLTPEQLDALQRGVSGIGSYLPFMQAAQTATTAGAGLLGRGADILTGADTRSQFDAARQAMTQAGTPISQLDELAFAAGQGAPLLGGAATDVDLAQAMAQQYAQANLGPAQNLMLQSIQQAQGAGPQFGAAQQRLLGGAGLGETAAERARQAALATNLAPIEQRMLAAGERARAGGPQFGAAQGLVGQGVGALTGAAQGFSPSNVQAFMNPYQQQVIDESLRQINRQGDIARQNLQAQAVRAGAFGGSREGIQRAELERGLSEQRNAAITGALAQGYQSAAQQAQQAFEQQQQRQLSQAQGFQGAAGQLGSLEAQRAQQALAAEQFTGGLEQQLAAQRFQQAGLGQQAAQQLAQAGQMGMQAGSQLGSLEAQRAQQALAAAQFGGNIGQQLAAQALQQAGLGQGAAGLYGNLAQQQAALAGQYGDLAARQASILGQQAQLGQAQAAGLGSLAQGQFGVGSQLAAGLGSLGTQLGAVGLQQGQLGEASQRLGQQDVSFLYGLGQQQQTQKQREVDALRATQLQTAYQPYQQLAFLSDIYKGAPSTQMALTTQAAPAPSPFQQVAGLGTGLLATGAAINQAGRIF
jgi:hypothetical protein